MEIKERGIGRMTLGGKERGFRIGTYQAKVFCDVRGIKLDQYFKELEKFKFENTLENNEWMHAYLHSALVAECVFNDEPVDFTPQKVGFWADAAPLDEVAKLFHVMFEMLRNTPKKSGA